LKGDANMDQFDELVRCYPVLLKCRQEFDDVVSALIKCFEANHRLYIIGNGGSASDALHISGELVKSFILNRSLEKSFIKRLNNPELVENLQGALPAIALVENTALSTAFANDCNPDYIYAQQIYAYAREGDCVIGISTSGNSKNIISGIETAKGRGAVSIGLTGKSGGKLKGLCDHCICVPEIETYKIQELHLPVYHAICLALEQHFWGKKV